MKTVFVGRFALAAASAVVLAACSEGRNDYAAAPSEGMMAKESARAAYAGDAAVSPAPPPGQGGDAANAGVMLAYSYSMSIEAPKGAIAPLAKAHEKACIDAGPAVCQVMGSSVNSYGEDQVSAYLNLRAEPKWLEGFRETIVGDAQKFDGEVTANTVSAEDLTQYIIDTSARLDAKKTLRERIKTLLETREGSLNDILAAERALADVQGEIDAMTAQLDAAEARVSMSSLSISYSSDPETSVSMWKPLAEAFQGFGRTSMQSLAEAVTFVARAWPTLILVLVVLSILRVWWRGRRKTA
ncbi:MAG: DUF4349 domain-containing protein [Parvularculaceae bacterium]